MKSRFYLWLGLALLVLALLPASPALAQDTDGDGAPDISDPCPNQKGSGAIAAGQPYYGCPDSDSDGVADVVDSCPSQMGIASRNGCPASEGDADGDGVADARDACPTQNGRGSVQSTDPNYGCPDRDFDAVADKADTCPDAQGPASNNGCPTTLDTDGDGISDGSDFCSARPGPADNAGCPLDADRDGDGIQDKDDLCRTEKGTAANKGCANPPAATPTPTLTPSPTTAGTTNTTAPTNTPSSTPVSATRAVLPANTNGLCLVMPNVANFAVNTRQSPGETAALIGTIDATRTYRAIAQGTEADGRVWYQLENGAWVADRVLDKAGPCTSLANVTSTTTTSTNTTAPTLTPTPAGSGVLAPPVAVPASVTGLTAYPANRTPLSVAVAPQMALVAESTLPAGLVYNAQGQAIAGTDIYDFRLGLGPQGQAPNIPTTGLLAISPDGLRYAAMANTTNGLVLGIASLDGLTPPVQWGMEVNRARFNPAGTALVAYLNNGTISPNGTSVVSFLNPAGTGQDQAVQYQGLVVGLIFSPDGSRLMIHSVDLNGQNWLNVVDATQPSSIFKLIPTESNNASAEGSGGLAFKPSGDILALGDMNGGVQLWQSETWAKGQAFTGILTAPVYALAFDPTGTLLAVGGGIAGTPASGTEVKILDATAGTVLASLPGHTGVVRQMFFTPDGTLLITISDAGEVKAWGVAAP
jgi:hypothetical protein